MILIILGIIQAKNFVLDSRLRTAFAKKEGSFLTTARGPILKPQILAALNEKKGILPVGCEGFKVSEKHASHVLVMGRSTILHCCLAMQQIRVHELAATQVHSVYLVGSAKSRVYSHIHVMLQKVHHKRV